MGNCLCIKRHEIKQNMVLELEQNKELDLKESTKEVESEQNKEPEPITMVARRGCSHCGRSDGDWTCPKLGTCSCPPNAPLPSCVFYSSRIQGVYDGEMTELESTEQHWTDMDSMNDVEVERVGEENRKYFNEVLMKHRDGGDFFSRFKGLMLGDIIGEGGQAKIFAAKINHGIYKYENLVAKVFKKDISLKDLERQWPHEMIYKEEGAYGIIPSKRSYPFQTNGGDLLRSYPFQTVLGGAFIQDGEHKDKFAFVMRRRLCDVRTFIDQTMVKLLHKNHHGPPFSELNDVHSLLQAVAFDMFNLHKVGVVHRDIKASNVLMGTYDIDTRDRAFFLMDFECANGTMGTGFWRAPEILEQVQRGVPSHEVVFTKEADVYSYGMLCYEILTGCIPFEGHPQNDYGIVLSGERPKLPHDLHSTIKNLILDCWKHDPQQRPSAGEVYSIVGWVGPYHFKNRYY